MGLTIHYSLKTEGEDAQARNLITALHRTAADLPFKELGEVVELSGVQCNFNRRQRNDQLRWLLIQATQSVELKSEGGRQTWIEVTPSRLIAFDTWPGEGCEAANFGLCQYPATIKTPSQTLPTGLAGWHWSSFCKTQYASDPQCGGVSNFLRCHLTVVALLDRAKELGGLESVSDEGGFWERRDLPALVAEIGSWNEMLAAFGGKLKDLLGDGPTGVQSAIAQYPNFEQLEAAGEGRLPAEINELVQLIGRVGVMAGQTRPSKGAKP